MPPNWRLLVFFQPPPTVGRQYPHNPQYHRSQLATPKQIGANWHRRPYNRRNCNMRGKMSAYWHQIGVGTTNWQYFKVLRSSYCTVPIVPPSPVRFQIIVTISSHYNSWWLYQMVCRRACLLLFPKIIPPIRNNKQCLSFVRYNTVAAVACRENQFLNPILLILVFTQVLIFGKLILSHDNKS